MILNLKRYISLLLVLMLLIGIVPQAYAAEVPTDSTIPEENISDNLEKLYHREKMNKRACLRFMETGTNYVTDLGNQFAILLLWNRHPRPLRLCHRHLSIHTDTPDNHKKSDTQSSRFRLLHPGRFLPGCIPRCVPSLPEPMPRQK